MPLSPLLTPSPYSDGAGFSVRSLDLRSLGHLACPVTQLDDFRVSGAPFGPHPHAGFCAVSYLFEDSPGRLRSRDSLGNDLLVNPGGLVWTQAGSGLLHHELPELPGAELHGLQFFVNLSARNKLCTPAVLSVAADQVPVWHPSGGGSVRVVVGEYGALRSPLRPAEPFTLLDIRLQAALTLALPAGHSGVLYVLDGRVTVDALAGSVMLRQHQAIVVDDADELRLAGSDNAWLVWLAAARIDEPQVSAGPFLMNTQEQMEQTVRRFRSGEMGRLGPTPA